MFCTCCTSEEEKGSFQMVDVDDENLPQGKEERRVEPEPAVEIKAPPAAPSNQEARGFSFTVERQDLGKPLGAVLDPSGNQAIHVCSILPGDTAISEASRQAPQGQELRVGDFITEVNGLTSDLTVMLNEVLSKLSVTMRVSRPEHFEISINRKSGSLGCGITYDAANGTTLVIESVNDGPISDWNAAKQGPCVLVGDRIIAANDKTGSSTELLELIRSIDGVLKLRFSRPASRP